jgi:peptide/nickel transport system ATP-binding protein/oligopeptide transport system ATP-binding protein
MSPQSPGEPTANLVEVTNLVKYFPVRQGVFQRVGAWVQAVDDVSFSIRRGETLGLVGESGCGKTTVGRAILRLIEPTRGSVRFDGVDLTRLNGGALRAMRRSAQIIFQDPYSSLDPRKPIGESIAEGLNIHRIGTPRERFQTVLDLLRIPMSFPADSASGLGSPAPWPSGRSSSSPTSRSRPSTSRSRLKSSICSRTCRRTST